MPILDEYPKLLAQLRQLDPTLRQLIRRSFCDISEVQKLFPNVRKKGKEPRAVLHIAEKPKQYKVKVSVSFRMLRPILPLPAEIDVAWLEEWASRRIQLRNMYKAAQKALAVARTRGYETELVEINDKLYRVRKGNRLVMLDLIAAMLKEGRHFHVHAISEELYQWRLDEIDRGRTDYHTRQSWLKPVEDWTSK